MFGFGGFGGRLHREQRDEWATSTRSPSSTLLSPFLGEGSPTKIDNRIHIGYQLSLTSNLEDLVDVPCQGNFRTCSNTQANQRLPHVCRVEAAINILCSGRSPVFVLFCFLPRKRGRASRIVFETESGGGAME